MGNKQSKNNTKIASISSCLIVKNEINNLPLLIEDLKQFSDEIIIVDTGSTDGTLEWLKSQQTNVLKLYEFEWIDDFSAARNFSYSKATKSWIFWCDGDDRISKELIDKLNSFKSIINSDAYLKYNAYAMIYQYTDIFEQYRIRLIKRSARPKWEGIVHEFVECKDMNVFTFPTDCVIIHNHSNLNDSIDRNIKIFQNYVDNGHILSTRETFCYAHDLIAYDYKDDDIKKNECHKKAQELALSVLLDPNSWEVLIWEAMTDVLAELWMSSPSYANVGIALINRLEETKRMRADVYYLRAVLYDIIGDAQKSIKDCYNAVNTVVTGIDTYNEKLILSKVYPAISIYNEAKDEFTKDIMIDIIKKHRSLVKEADDFLNSIENPLVLTPMTEEEFLTLSNESNKL